MDIIERLLGMCRDIRRKPIPVSGVIPLMQEASAELARLRAENERLRADNVHLRGHFEKAWPDTQRYRWLRATNMEQQNILAHYAYTEMDAAIDAAMAQGKV